MDAHCYSEDDPVLNRFFPYVCENVHVYKINCRFEGNEFQKRLSVELIFNGN